MGRQYRANLDALWGQYAIRAGVEWIQKLELTKPMRPGLANVACIWPRRMMGQE